MAKTVLTNHMVAHVWAQQIQESGRSGNGNFSFEGNTLRSYSTPIARIVETRDGSKAALVTTRTYSVTTSGKHMSRIWGAVSHMRVHHVYDVLASGERDHAANLKRLLESYQDGATSLLRKQTLSEWQREQLQRSEVAIVEYAEDFGLGSPEIDADSDWTKAQAAYQARNTPEMIAKRKKEAESRLIRKEKKEAEDRERLAKEEAERLPRWRAGESVRAPYGDCYLRVVGDELQTSLGASVPLPHAIRAFRIIKTCKDRGQAWETNGHKIPVGHFQVDKIEPSGNIKAGCHYINWNEIELIAREIGVFNQAA